VRYFGDGPENLLSSQELMLRRGDSVPRAFNVTGARQGARASEILVSFAGCKGREAAEAMRGYEVLGEAGELMALPEGEFYWHQLVGCRVATLDDQLIGRVKSLWDAGGHDLLVVEREEGGEVLIPTSKEVLREIDLEAKTLRIDTIPGLLETEVAKTPGRPKGRRGEPGGRGGDGEDAGIPRGK
jgi:16S rRNA processing protein RimM